MFYIAIVKGNGAEVAINDKQFLIREGIFLCSQMTSRVNVSFKEKTKVFFIQLEPWTTSYLYKNDFSEFSNTIVEINLQTTLFDIPTKDLLKRSLNGLIGDINSYFEKRAKSFKTKNDIETSCYKIIKSCGEIDIKNIYKGIKISQRTFQTHFKKATGLTLSKFIRIIKLRASINELHGQQVPKKFTEIALDKYYDQAHFIKSFKEIVKTTPKKFQAKLYLLSKKR